MKDMPTPTNQEDLIAVLKDCVEEAKRIIEHMPSLVGFYSNPFESLMAHLYVEEGDPEVEIKPGSIVAKLQELNFKGASLVDRLNRTRLNDSHLFACTTPWMLCRLVGKFVDMMTAGPAKADSTESAYFDESVANFLHGVYSEPFGMHVVSHLYNFEADSSTLAVAGLEIVRLEKKQIEVITGSEQIALLYTMPLTGDFFVIDEISDPNLTVDNFYDYINPAIEACDDLIGVMQYMKDGVLNRDYSLITLRPPWVNNFVTTIPLGESQKLPFANGKQFFKITVSEMNIVESWLDVYQNQLKPVLYDHSSDLANALKVAMDFFASSHESTTSEERLINLMVALEALFSPEDNKELSYRIRQYASQLIGDSTDERHEIFTKLGKLYSLRSQIVHGTLDINKYREDTLVPPDSTLDLISIVRRGILRLLVLFLRGRRILRKNKGVDSIHGELDRAALDESLAEALRVASNPQRYVGESIFSDSEVPTGS
jgi:hypothetical protein